MLMLYVFVYKFVRINLQMMFELCVADFWLREDHFRETLVLFIAYALFLARLRRFPVRQGHCMLVSLISEFCA